MHRPAKIGVVAFSLLVAAAAAVPSLLFAADAPPIAVAPSLTTASAKPRAAEAIMKDLNGLDDKITDALPTPRLLADPKFRAGDGQKALPLLNQGIGLMGELQAALSADPKYKDISELQDQTRTGRDHLLAYAAILGDAGDLATLQKQADGKDAAAVDAKSALALEGWVLANGDAAAQQKILDDFGALAKDHADSDEIAGTLGAMANLAATNDDLSKKAIEIVRTSLKGDAAKQIASDFDSQQAQLALVGKPLTVSGRTSTGGHFSSADYKGKVVLVDFWATWCGPCLGELPNVQKAYAELHPKGLEIVGVSCDTGDTVLNDFTQKNAMPWVQLRETSQTEDGDRWHPLAKQWHVDGIPTMFLIDKKGVLRYVDAREDLAKKAADLIAEKD